MEERRVGKECKSRGSPCQWQQKRLDQRRVKGREVGSPLVVAVDPGRPCRVDTEAAEHERSKCGCDPPGVAAQGGAEAAFLEVADGRRHSTSRMRAPKYNGTAAGRRASQTQRPPPLLLASRVYCGVSAEVPAASAAIAN